MSRPLQPRDRRKRPARKGRAKAACAKTNTDWQLRKVRKILDTTKKRGFELSEIVARLHEKGIEIKPQTLSKYLAEARRQQEARKTKRQAAHPHCSAPQTACRNAGP